MVVAVAQDGSWQTLKDDVGISSMHTAVTRFDTAILLDRTNVGLSTLLLPNGRCRVQPLERMSNPDCYAHSVMYDPNANTVRALYVFTDTWCSSGQFFADGSLVQTGGDFEGAKKIRRLVPCQADETCDWVESTTEELAVARWYATSHLLPDGKSMIIMGGRNNPTYEFVPKRFPGEGVYPLELLKTPGYDNLYPFVNLLPDGNLFIFATKDSILLNPYTGEVLRQYPTLPGNSRNYPAAGSSVLLPLSYENGFQTAEVLICGGATQASNATAPASKSCGRMEVTSATPSWLMEDQPVARTMGDMIILPNGDVLIINGAKIGAQGWGKASNPVFQPCQYARNDALNRFRLLAATTVPRMYHSTANLLSDGRILLAGSNTHQYYTFKDTPFPTELRVEAFSPPYLNVNFDDQRPEIIVWPTKMKYGRRYLLSFSVATGALGNLPLGAGQEQRFQGQSSVPVEVNLNSAPFVTHSYAHGQRQLKLETLLVKKWGKRKQQNLQTLLVTAPPSMTVAPPQYYMLFVVNGGIPGKAVWVQVYR